MLGGRNGTGYQLITRNKGRQVPTLSRQSRTNLCCVLFPVIEVYEEILRGALNINQDAYFQSMSTFLNECSSDLTFKT
jgi:hypothetical protein